MRSLVALLAASAALCQPLAAWAQSTPVYQIGTLNSSLSAPGALAKLIRDGSLAPVGGVLGDNAGNGVNPFMISDGGALGLCLGTANTGSPYRAFCIGHDTNGNALLTVDSYGIAGAGMHIRVNGTTYSFPGSGSGDVVGPQTSAVDDLVLFNSIDGTLLKDGGKTLPSGYTIPSATITGPTISGGSGAFTTLSGTNAISSLPSTLANVPAVLNQTLTGSALGTSGAGFNVVDQAAALHIVFNQFAGYNTDTGDGNNQSGATATFYNIVTNSSTQAATAAITVESTLFGAKAGATDFLANPSVQMLTGQINAGNAGVYLNPIEYLLADQGFDVAAYGQVIRLDRTNNTGALGTTWVGFHVQSDGTKNADALFDGVGMATIGLNLVGMSNFTAAFATAAGAGWYGNATNSCGNLRPTPSCESLGTDVISDTAPGWQFVVGGTTVMNMSATLVAFDVSPQFVFSTTGSSTVTFTNAPAAATTEQWIPVKINGHAHTYYLAAVDAGF